jgi:hypothetical protein
MELFDCAVGQRVRHKETGKLATIKQLARAKGEVEIAFDNGLTVSVSPKMIEPSAADAATPRAPKRPCPQCGADMGDQSQCGQCGFAYRTAPKRRLPLAVTLLIALAVVAVIAALAWKFLLGQS